jgi:ribose 1,5-bisphosphokinase
MTASGASTQPVGPGPLVLVVGPSGAGKDTLIDKARARLAEDGRVLFARRLVTRPPGAGEAHGTLGEADFAAGCAAARFPLSWRAHGLGYALGPEVAAHLRGGGVVVANGSRASLPQARRRFATVRVVLVSAPAEVRAIRLAARGRESAAEIAARLRHAPAVEVAPDLVIENVGSPEAGGEALAAFIAAVLGGTGKAGA